MGAIRVWVIIFIIVAVTATVIGYWPHHAASELNLLKVEPQTDLDSLVIDLGTPRAREVLHKGWSFDEMDDTGRTVIWGIGESSHLEVNLDHGGEAKLLFHARPMDHPDHRTQSIEVFINDERVSYLKLHDGWHEYDVTIKEGLLQKGPNRISFVYAYTLVPSSMDGSQSSDRRSLSVVWDWMKIRFAKVQKVIIDLGEPHSEKVLKEKWSKPERDKTVGSFRWCKGTEATLEITLALSLGPAALVGQARAIEYPGAPPQHVDIYVNKQKVGRTTIGTQWQQIRFPLPSNQLLRGVNHLRFVYAYARNQSKTTPGSDADRVSVAWKRIGIEAIPGVYPVPGGLELNQGTYASWVVNIQPGTRIDLESAPEADFLINVVDPATGVSKSWTLSGAGTVRLWTSNDPVTLVRLSIQTRPFTQTGATLLKRARLYTYVPKAGAFSPKIPNIVLYLVDSLRPDHLEPYRYRRATSPMLNRFAQKALIFEHAFAQSSDTTSAEASILTGLYPREHKAIGEHGKLMTRVRLLSEMLQTAGFRTAAFVSQRNLAGMYGFDAGYDKFVLLNDARSQEITAKATRWLQEVRASDRPFFLFMHTIDPSAPYQPPDEFKRKLAAHVIEEPLTDNLLTHNPVNSVDPNHPLIRQKMALYDAEIASNDSQFGALMSALEAENRLDQTVVIFSSTHGQEFGEHGGWSHGTSLYNEQLRVPLIIDLPKEISRADRDKRLAQHIDIVPTLLDLLGIPKPSYMQGLCLLKPPVAHPLFSFLKLSTHEQESVIFGPFKLIRYRDQTGEERYELFNRRRDFKELHPINRPDLIDRMKQRLDQHHKHVTAFIAIQSQTALNQIEYSQ